VQELEALLQQSEQEKAALQEEVKHLQQKMDRLTEQFLNAQRARFGQSSEKKKYVMDGAEQVQLFNEAEVTQNPKAEEPTIEEVIVAAHKRKKKRTYEELTEGLPEEEILLELKGDFPTVHEKLDYQQFTFEIMELDERRISKVKVIVHEPLTDTVQ
jgi:hypothetical protein